MASEARVSTFFSREVILRQSLCGHTESPEPVDMLTYMGKGIWDMKSRLRTFTQRSSWIMQVGFDKGIWEAEEGTGEA